MKREREDDEQPEASSDDEMGPMPVSDVQVAKKKRKGASTSLVQMNVDLLRHCIQYYLMKRYF